MSVGKNALKLKEMTIEERAMDNHHTFQSVTAITRPFPWVPLSDESLSPTPTSSTSRFSARRRSIGESQVEVAGKSGRINIATRAKKTVKAPSMKKSHLKKLIQSSLD